MFDQKFEHLKTDQEQLGKVDPNPSSRSIILREQSDSEPIVESEDHQIVPRRVQDLVGVNKIHRGSHSLPVNNLRGPKYGAQLPVISKQDDSPKNQHSDSSSGQIEDGFCNAVWQKQPFEIFLIVLRFISIITKSNFATSFRLVNSNVFAIIGDKSANFRYYVFNNYLKYEKPTYYQYLKFQLNKKLLVPLRKMKIYTQLSSFNFLLRPESMIAIGWNIYILSILNLNVLYVSTKIAFQIDTVSFGDDFYQFRQIAFDVLPSYSFMLEILLKFNTCYYNKGSLIQNRIQIGRNYLRSSFLFDIFVVIPFFLSLRFKVDYLDLVIILKVFQIQKFSGTLFERLELNSSQIALFDLIKLCYTILAAAHFCACLWFLVGRTGDPNEISWISSEGLQDQEWINQYFHSFYYSIVTMTTIGYGDITPKNLRERIFTIGMAVVACGIFGYSLGNISNIFAEWSRRSYQFRTDMNNLKKYMRIKGINKQLAEKVRKYFEYVWSDLNEDNEKETYKFLDQIPHQLHEEITVDINMKSVRNIPFLTENFSEQFQIELSKHLVEQKYRPEQIIYNQDESSDYFYIIEKGAIQYFIELKNKEKQQLVMETISACHQNDIHPKGGQPFGQLEFFQNQPYQMSCKSKHFSSILSIPRHQFIQLLRTNSKDYYRFCELRDQVQFIGKQEAISRYCRACNKPQHVIKECPMVCGYPNRAKVLLNNRRNIPSDRVQYYVRKSERKIKTLKESTMIRNSVYLYLCKEPSHIVDLNDSIYNEDPDMEESQNNINILSPITSHYVDEGQNIRKLQFQHNSLQDPAMILKIKGLMEHLKQIEIRDVGIDSKNNMPTTVINPFDEKGPTLQPSRSGSSINQNLSIFYNEDPKTFKSPTRINRPAPTKRLSRVPEDCFDCISQDINDDEIQLEVRVEDKQVFEKFEKRRNFDYYLKHNNIQGITEQWNLKCPIFKLKHTQVLHSRR